MGRDSNPPYGHGGVTTTARDPAPLVASRQMTSFRDMTLQIAGVPAGHRLLTA
jgi:hypothetical protein